MHAAATIGSRVAHYVYGAIVALALLAALDTRPLDPLKVVGVLLGTLVVIALAHAHAEIAGEEYHKGRRLQWRAGYSVFLATWPLVAAGVLPALIFLTAAGGAVSLDFAFDASTVVVCLSLFVIGYLSQRGAGGSIGRSIVDGCVDLSLGLVIVALKFLLD